MTYDELLTYLKQPRHDYYVQLLLSADEIIKQTKTRPNYIIAEELNLTTSKFSAIFKMLEAYNDISSSS